jgi:hypothetical protein
VGVQYENLLQDVIAELRFSLQLAQAAAFQMNISCLTPALGLARRWSKTWN